MTLIFFSLLFVPTNDSAGSTNVAGVISNVAWNGGSTDPISIFMQVSTTNKTTVSALLHTTLTNLDVEFMFDVYEYDPVAHVYFKCAHSNGVILKGVIEKIGSDLQIQIATNPSTEVMSPENFELWISIKPQAIDQEIHRAFSVSNTFVSAWGVLVGAKIARLAKTAVACNYVCNVAQGFNFQSDVYDPLGVVTSMKISTTQLAQDFALNIDAVMPVELQTFSADMVHGRAELHWSTATETNNIGFDIEKKIAGAWTKIGFVRGAGTANAPNHYSFVDPTAKGKASYRLKQIDRDGHFSYSQSVEVVAALAAGDFALSQNFPNPFNPTTMFTFAVKSMEHVTVTVFNALGQEVATLFNGNASPNELYHLRFDGTNLPGGTYFCALRSASRSEVKKVTMLK
ncbi:MAG TPA: T9SS type A sorting domain-containing protein [Bacteroidota bacterium]|nr:T9SS type A sorting domain-containing protein [Bacteroidota bacterium]